MKTKQVDDRFAPGANPHERWIRLPTTGRDPTTGLTRPHFYLLIGKGEIKSAVLRRPGCTTGVRLVWLPSVLAYIERHVVSPDAGDGRAA
jgi:hypothetical protein